jgi:transposase
MKAYSEGLCTRIVQAVERGMTKTQAAKTFGVSRSSEKRCAAAHQPTGPTTMNKRFSEEGW